MSENSNQKALIEQLLNDRDAEFRRATKAEQQLKELDIKACVRKRGKSLQPLYRMNP